MCRPQFFLTIDSDFFGNADHQDRQPQTKNAKTNENSNSNVNGQSSRTMGGQHRGSLHASHLAVPGSIPGVAVIYQQRHCLKSLVGSVSNPSSTSSWQASTTKVFSEDHRRLFDNKEVAYLPPIQRPWVRFLAFPRIFLLMLLRFIDSTA